MKVFKVKKDLSVNFSYTFFTLHQNDIIFINDSNLVWKIGYSNGDSIHYMALKKPTNSIRILDRFYWLDINASLGYHDDIISALEDITITWNREERLKTLLN
jgi:hypothetical protein